MKRSNVEDLAEYIAKEYNPDGISPFPYSLIQVDNRNLSIYFIDTLPESVSGVILTDDEKIKFSIVINKTKSDKRQYFTVAHELGHYILHKDFIKKNKGVIDGDNSLDESNGMMFRSDNAPTTEMEIEANRFAASLIMPEKWVLKAWSELENVVECAKVFNVSVSAMSIRLERLGLLK